MNWQREIDDLHAYFQAYFLGTEDSLEPVEAALHADFSMVGPHGGQSNRDETIAAVRNGHAHTKSLEIWITDHRLLYETTEVLVAGYVEHHRLSDRSNHRLSTVVFVETPDAPNGVRWLRVHETWLAGD